MTEPLTPLTERITGFVELQAQTHPDAPCIGHFTCNGYEEITYRQFTNCINNAAHYFKQHNINEGTVVGYVAPTEPEYLINLFALMQIGAIPLALSTRNSGMINSDLLTHANSQVLIYEDSFKELAESMKDFTLLPRPNFNAKEVEKIQFNLSNTCKDTAMIIHSSGSTSRPKLVPLSHKYITAVIKRERESGLPSIKKGGVLSYGPMFHLYGFGSFIRVLGYAGYVVLPSQSIGGAKSMASDISLSNCNRANLLPFIAQGLIDNAETDWDILSKLDQISVAGAFFPRRSTHFFLDKGIKVSNVYGASETGIIGSCLASKENPEDFGRNIRMWSGIKFEIVNQTEDADGSEGQILIKPNDDGLATGMAKPEGYLIEDRIKILEHTPTCFRFQILGRADDLLVHFSGEKTNPLPIEDKINSHPLIKRSVVLLSSDHLHCCALIQLDAAAQKVPILEIAPKVLAHIAKVNNSGASYSRILSDYVYILPFSSDLPVTAKGNLMRGRIVKHYADILDSFGTKENTSTDSNSVVKATSFDLPSIQAQLRDHFNRILLQKVEDSKSFFSQGLDSLSAVKFRTLINTSYPDANISINTIYEEDTILALSQFIYAVFSGEAISTKTLQDYQAEVNETINRFTQFNETALSPVQKRPPGSKLNVLITGANGSLGSFIIKCLLNNPNIGKIFGLARAKSKQEAQMRVKEGFEERFVQLSDEQWSRFHHFPYVAEDEYLGMGDKDYEEVVPQVDIIYHVAWRMDFLRGLAMFEDLVQGTTNLLNISAKSPFRPAYHFTSTVGATLPVGAEQPVPEVTLEPVLKNIHACNGYNLSKLVSEQIAIRYSKHFHFPLNIHRVGQIGGDSEKGAWNIREHVPLLIKGAQLMGVAPATFMPRITWIPVDIAGKAMAEINFTCQDTSTVYINHITNPHSVSWSDVLDMLLKCGVQFKVAPASDFVDLLRTSAYQDVQTNPLASLTDYFSAVLSKPDTDIVMATSTTSTRSESINTCPPVNQAWMEGYVRFWRDIGFLQ